jgi:RNA polymerase sigma-54 factor
MALGPRLDLRATQTLTLTPQLAQAIRLLQLSNLELEAAVAEEIARNPLLEAQSDEGGEAPDGMEIAGGQPEGGDAQGSSDQPDWEGPDARGADDQIAGGDGEEPLDVDWQDEALQNDSFSDVVSGVAGGDEPDLERLRAEESSLTDHLLGQLHGLGGAEGMLARHIAESLDETGYLLVALDEIAEATGAPPALVERALRHVQDLDPPGIGARTLAECLALQAKAADRYDPAMARLIDNLDLLAKGRLTDLKRICGVDDEDLKDMIAELRAFDPKPGCRFSASGMETAPIAPDVFVRRTRGGFAVELNSATLPRLLVNRRYYQELRSGASSKQSRAWLSECLASANWLLRALDQRAKTIVKVVSEVVKRQQGFFEQGVGALKPLTLREVAEAIEMHESTVSRVTSNKYLLCDRGLFELKYFFGSGVNSTAADGEGASAQAVKAAIREIVDAETTVLSDEQIGALLKQRGFDCARRTVVKYRESMGIGSSVQRRRQRKIAGVG